MNVTESVKMDLYYYNELGEIRMTKIEIVRRRYGLSRKELSTLLNVPYSTLTRWELETSKCPDYVEDLIIYKVVNEMKNRKNEKEYFIIDIIRNGDIWGTDKPYTSYQEAREEGQRQWEHLTQHDKNRRVEFCIATGNTDDNGYLDMTEGYDVEYDFLAK